MSFAYGSGTEADPYQVWTPADLDNVRNFLSAYFIQMADLDMSDWGTWVPIGNFGGTYNGNKKVIKDLTGTTGLFGSNSFGKIYDLGLLRVTMKASSGYVGAFVSYSGGYCQISRCFVKEGYIEGTSQTIGGLVGYATGQTIIEDCYFIGEVKGQYNVGGIAGYSRNSGVTIRRCCVNCTVSAPSGSAGLIAGYHRAGSISECFVLGSSTLVSNGGTSYYGRIFGQTRGAGKDNYAAETIPEPFQGAWTDKTTSGKDGADITVLQLEAAETYVNAGWDFENIWAIHPGYNDGYPYFLWEWSPEPPIIIDTVPAYSPQSIVNLVFQAGDSAEYPMGKFYVDRMQYSVNTESMRIDARNSIGKYLKDQTFDERNSYEVIKVSDMLEAILSGAGLSDYYVQPNNTYLGMEFAPNKDMLGGIEEVVQYIENWQIREEVSGRVVIADKTSSEFTQPSRYTFRRDRDIFSRDVSADDRSVYARVCVHTADFSVKVYRPVNTNLGWNAPANKTLYQTVPDGTTSYEAAGIAVKLAESMANSGAIETFVCAFRPQIIPGDEAEILEEDESATMLGIITQVKHSFGTGGFFTEIVVDSGGRIGKPRLKEIIGSLAPPPASKRL